MSYQYQDGVPFQISDSQISEALSAVMRRVYLWMCLGLLLTAGVAWVVVNSAVIVWLVQNSTVFYGLLIAELIMVVGLSASIDKLSPAVASMLFFAYAALNGVTLSFIFLIYTSSSISLAFVATASLFGAMSIIGYTTKIDLTKYGGFLFMGLIGLLIGSVVNAFWANSTLDWFLTYAGIFLFLGLTVYDTQRIKTSVVANLSMGNKAALSQIGLLGALRLYLDFINLFLRLLRLMGRKRR